MCLRIGGSCRSPVLPFQALIVVALFSYGCSGCTDSIERSVGIGRSLEEEKQLPKMFQRKRLLISPAKRV
jgi:hypothetical protein